MKIKSLEWNKSTSINWIWLHAKTEFGTQYIISSDANEESQKLGDVSLIHDWIDACDCCEAFEDLGNDFESIESAQAAAQEDHKKRIMNALELENENKIA